MEFNIFHGHSTPQDSSDFTPVLSFIRTSLFKLCSYLVNRTLIYIFIHFIK